MPVNDTRTAAELIRVQHEKALLEKEIMDSLYELPELPEDPVLPLDYMLRVLNDPEASPERRDKMAALAAPFLHKRIPSVRIDERLGKKEKKAEAAKQAAESGRFLTGAAPLRVVQGQGR